MSYIGNPISIMDYPVDYFTGDGTSTTFQLSRIPASATSILVHIGGVKQVASTTDPAYYLDGSKLVFVSPPGAYSPIEVNYLGIAGQVNIPGVQSVTQDMLSLQLANTFVYQTTANGATASFTLNAPPVSANSLVVSANGVVQYDYSVNGTNLTFGFTPPVGTFIRVTSLALAQAGVPADGSVTSVKLGANLTITGNTTFDGFAGSPARIRGDFTNATIANRAAIQTSTTNGNTVLGIIPNGSATQTQLQLFSSPDFTNYSRLAIQNTGSEMRLYGDSAGSGTALPLTMYTAATERMRIDTSGNVGIGTNSPTFGLGTGLQIAGAGYAALSLKKGSVATGHAIDFVDSTNTLQFRIGTNFASGGNNLLFAYGTTPTIGMTLDASGNVGIGTSSPSQKLTVSGNINTLGGSGLRLGDTGLLATANYLILGQNNLDTYLDGSNINFRNATGGLFVWYTNSAERMRIDSSGNVGIGTSSPNARLNVSAATSTIGQLRIDGTGTGAGAVFIGQTAGSIGFIHSNAGTLAFGTSTSDNNLTERMRIDSSGNVGIGTSSPSRRLMVEKSAGAVGFGSPYVQVGAANYANGGYYTIGFGYVGGSYTTAPAEIGAIATDDSGGGKVALTFATRDVTTNTAPTERMRIDSGGRVTMPFQPTFYGGRTAGDVGSTTVFVMNDAQINIGSCYNTSTGVFTCPVAGVYFVSFGVMTAGSYGGDIDFFYIQKNGANVVSNYTTGTNTTYQRIAATALISCAANDTIRFRTGGTTIYGASSTHSYGSIYLMR